MAVPNSINPSFQDVNVKNRAYIGSPSSNSYINNTAVHVGSDLNDYSQFYFRNQNSGDTASTDFICGADNDNPSVAGRFIDIGVNSSTYLGTSAAQGIIKTVSVTAGGTGYQVGNILTLATGDVNAVVEVLTLSGSAVATVSILENGTSYTTGTKATTGGAGTGCTINVLTLYDLTGLLANDGYVYTSGGNTVIGTDDTVASKIIKFLTGGLATANERARIDNDGFTVLPQNAPTAGGTVSRGLRLGSTTNFGVFYGSGVPTLSAAQGSLYMRTDGSSTSTRLYVNTNGTTGWTAMTSAT